MTHLPRDIALARLGYSLKRPIFALPIYRYSLGARGATELELVPSDPWPGDTERGADMLRGDYPFSGGRVLLDGVRRNLPDAGATWLDELHGFNWLRDLRAASGDGARRSARELVEAWLQQHDTWSAEAWGPLALGQRLANWLGCYEFFGASGDIEFRRRLLGSLSRQARHLDRALPAGLSGADLITAAKGLIYAGLCLPGGASWRRHGEAILRREVRRQVLSDGGHVERNPSRHLMVLRDLIDVRALLHKAASQAGHETGRTGRGTGRGTEGETATFLGDAVESMAPVLRMFQHGDGGLALFNGSTEEDGWQVDMVLQRAGNRQRALTSAPESGFQRLHAGRSLVLMDTGDPPAPGFDALAHAGTLSFEMSVGRERLIVNCGARPGDATWQGAQRATAAHSALVLGDRNSSELTAGQGLGRRGRTLQCRREESDSGIWLDASQNGYLPPFGLIHRRRLYLAASGTDLRGEDRLEPRGRARGAAFAIRFHLHPEVQSSLARGGNSVLLRLPKGGGWELRAAGASVSLEQSIYLGRAGEIRRSQQILLSGETDANGTAVKWALRRIERSRA
jgi:uncharacterized heparinase superfamily protein